MSSRSALSLLLLYLFPAIVFLHSRSSEFYSDEVLMFEQIEVNWLGALLARWACKLVSSNEKRRHFLTGFLEVFLCRPGSERNAVFW